MKTKTTTDGHTWTEVQKDYWRDDATGLVWSPEIGKFNFDDAQTAATKHEALDLKWSVPTKKDWMMAEIHDVREVLDLKDKWFWSSLPFNGGAWVFSGYDGGVGFGYRGGPGTVRCVGR